MCFMLLSRNHQYLFDKEHVSVLNNKYYCQLNVENHTNWIHEPTSHCYCCCLRMSASIV